MSTPLVSKKFYQLLVSTPIIALVAFYSFVLRAYFALGRWPTPLHPDPKDLGFDMHMVVILFTSLFPYVVLLPWVVITIISWKRQLFSKKFLIIGSVIYLVSLVIFFLIIKLDPGSFASWFLD